MKSLRVKTAKRNPKVRELDFDAVVSGLLARRRLAARQHMPLILDDILDGSFTKSVSLQVPTILHLIASGNTDLDIAYAEFRHTNLNPLAAVFRPGLHPSWSANGMHRVSDLPALPLPGAMDWGGLPAMESGAAEAFQAPKRQEYHLNRTAVHEHSEQAGDPEHKIQSLSEAACFLHLEKSVIHKALIVLEANSHLAVPEIANQLACTARTMERHLRDEGTSAETLRSAVRLLKANAQLRTGEHLSTIALEQGFSDQAHMNKVFLRSCGLTPRALQQLYTGHPPSGRAMSSGCPPWAVAAAKT